jgi:hypothetical protein
MLDVLPPADPGDAGWVLISNHQQLYLQLRYGWMLAEI